MSYFSINQVAFLKKTLYFRVIFDIIHAYGGSYLMEEVLK